MAWFYLIVAVGCEIIWASTLKATEGYSQLVPSIFNAGVLAINLYFLSSAVKTLPVAIAYPIWTGLGAVGVVLGAVLFFHESLGVGQILCIFLIMLGVIGLELGKPKEAEEVVKPEEKGELTKLENPGEPIELEKIELEKIVATNKSEEITEKEVL